MSRPLSEEELRELCVELTTTLHAVAGQLDDGDEGEWPMPDSIDKALRERNALAVALASLPENVRGRLRTIFVSEMAKAYLDTSLFEPEPVIHFPIMDKVSERIEAVLDRVRIARLRDTALHDELARNRDLPFGM